MGIQLIKIVRDVLFLLLISFSYSLSGQSGTSIWFDEPAENWEETLPLGNGRLGMTPDSGVEKETIVLNDITLWSGQSQDANNYSAHRYLPEIRNLLQRGENHLAEELVNEHFICEGSGSGHGYGANVPFGCYQTMGRLSLLFDYGTAGDIQYSQYKRELDISNAIAKSTYKVDTITYTREYFTSFDDDISLVKLSASSSEALNFSIAMDRPERFETYVKNQELVMSGRLDNGTDGNGMRYKVKVGVRITDGSLSSDGNTLFIRDATEAILMISAGTDFRNKDFEKNIDVILKNTKTKPYSEQKAHHITNYQELFNRVGLKLGKSSKAELPTNERLEQYVAKPREDLALGALFFQFGRYLSISSTRVGLLPPNLQGLWAKKIQTPWNGDYHLDVNVQMNHWPLEVVNLSELNLPLQDFVNNLVTPGSRTAKAYYNAQGWIAHVITNVWGYTAPGESASWGISNAGAGWLCNNLWQHYAFTNDLSYLQDIYPVLKGSAQFYNSMLIEDPDTGWMVTAPSVSPENSFILPNGETAHVCMGPTIDNQIVRELFSHVIAASQTLDVDKDLRDQLASRLQQIPPVGVIGEDGRIMEWLKPYKETDPHHRHLSHLYGLYPASLISPGDTPELAQAAIKSLEVRGDDGPSWSIAYKILFWARLKDGDRAFKLLSDILRPTKDTHINYGAGGGVYSNLLSAGPPFQIDGNFGATAGIAEMLLQSHSGFIELLPALPESWSVSGSFRGLKARGNYTVNLKWEDGLVTDFSIFSEDPQPVKVLVNGEMRALRSVQRR